MYIKFLEFMKIDEEFVVNIQKKDKEEKHLHFIRLFKLISDFFEIPRGKLIKMDITDIYGALFDIMYAIDSTIHLKLSRYGSNDEEEVYKSRYEEYDKENGIEYDDNGNLILEYEDKEEDKSRWIIYRETIELIFRQSIELGNNSIDNCYKGNLINLIDSTDFLCENYKTSMKYREIEAKASSLF